jgi:hypothetical protein
MVKSEYEHSLEILLKVFNVFLSQAFRWLQRHKHASKELRNILAVWIHPKGMSNLVKTIALNLQVELPDPSLPEQQQHHALLEQLPLSILLNPSHPSLLDSALVKQEQLSEEEAGELGEGEEGMDEEEESGSLRVEEGSCYSGSDGRAYKRGPYKSYTMN